MIQIVTFDCDLENPVTKKLVPIIVGSSLAVLFVLVLIAFIIGRLGAGYSAVKCHARPILYLISFLRFKNRYNEK